MDELGDCGSGVDEGSSGAGYGLHGPGLGTAAYDDGSNAHFGAHLLGEHGAGRGTETVGEEDDVFWLPVLELEIGLVGVARDHDAG